MGYSKFDCEYREYLRYEVNNVCARYKTSVYGSFSTGNFHLSCDSLGSFSDVDLIYSGEISEHLKSDIASALHERTGLDIKVSIRENTRHVFGLPKNISWKLALIDTSITLRSELYLSDEYFSYLIAKYILRTVYADIYFERNITNYLAPSSELNNDSLFLSVASCKLYGGRLSDMNISDLNGEGCINYAEIREGLKLLCSLNGSNDINNYCNSFFNLTKKYGLSELRDDLSKKARLIESNPNKCFNADCQTWRSLSLALGLASG